LPSLEDIRGAAREIAAVMPSTPQFSWPLLDAHAGRKVWVKHENHTRLGAFKIRGGIIYQKKRRSARAIRPAWPSTYCLRTASGAPPQLTTQYDRLQKTGFQYTRRSWAANSLRTNRDDTVLKLFTSTDGATFGFTDSKRWT